MKILCLGPHPDDLEIGAGGTLINFARNGHEVYLMILTMGDMGGNPEVRKQEQMRSAEIIGAKEVYWGGYRDTMLVTNAESIRAVEHITKLIEPDYIFSNFEEDTHQDHRNLARIVNSAARNSSNIMFYETPTTAPSFKPNVFADISDVIEQKNGTLNAHASQMMKTNIRETSILEIAKSTAIFRGTQARVRFAEGFMSIRMLLNFS